MAEIARIVVWIAILIPTLYVADRLLLAAERKGWIYYRKYEEEARPHGGGPER